MNRNIPIDGYILPGWGHFRATAVAYMVREKVPSVENKDGQFYTLDELLRATIGAKCYKWEWVATLDGKEVGRGIREMTEGEMYDQYKTTNLDGLIERWNSNLTKSPDGSTSIRWYYTRLTY